MVKGWGRIFFIVKVSAFSAFPPFSSPVFLPLVNVYTCVHETIVIILEFWTSCLLNMCIQCGAYKKNYMKANTKKILGARKVEKNK